MPAEQIHLVRHGEVFNPQGVLYGRLPGYGLSFAPGQRRFAVEAMADCFADLMTDVLGYRRYGAQGGDWGSFITSRLGWAYPERLIGIHLNLMPLRRDTRMVADPTPEERRYHRGGPVDSPLAETSFDALRTVPPFTGPTA